MKKNKENIIILLMGAIIIIQFIFCILFATNTINLSPKKTKNENNSNSNINENSNHGNNSNGNTNENNNKIDYEKIYLDFINNQEYKKEIPDEHANRFYSILDINYDGIDELMIKEISNIYDEEKLKQNYDSIYGYDSIYSYENNKVILIESFEGEGGIRYNESDKTITYITSVGIGSGKRVYSFNNYRLINNKLIQVGIDDYIFNKLNNHTTTYSEILENGTEIEITYNPCEIIKQFPYTHFDTLKK